MVQMPVYPARPVRQHGEHWAVTALSTVLRVGGWLILCTLIAALMVALVAVYVFIPVLRGRR